MPDDELANIFEVADRELKTVPVVASLCIFAAMSEALAVPDLSITKRIHEVRGVKVMLDVDLAELYGVTTKRLNEQVKRNLGRFAADFMFRLTAKEAVNLKSQFATSSSWGGRRKSPTAFTEHGILMLSSVLSSDRAVRVNIHIMRVFVRLNRLLSTEKDIARKLDRMEVKVDKHDTVLRVLVKKVKTLGDQKAQPRKRFGYKGGDDV